MTVPTFLNSNYYYYERTGVTSMETVLSDLTTVLRANSPAWTVTVGSHTITCLSPGSSWISACS
jgi:hypothetical protein